MASHDTEIEYPKVYILINNDLGMSAGKKVAQGCHGCCKMTRALERTRGSVYSTWLSSGEAKISLKAGQEFMDAFYQKYHKTIQCFGVHDAGKTQIEAGSFTVLVLEPLLLKDKPPELNTLKLL
jgi:PTH2 family peptidyl-tRNA hydrolase